jgi:hypothetical protein
MLAFFSLTAKIIMNFILLISGSECKALYYKLKLQPLQRVRLFPSPSCTVSSAVPSEYGRPSCLLWNINSNWSVVHMDSTVIIISSPQLEYSVANWNTPWPACTCTLQQFSILLQTIIPLRHILMLCLYQCPNFPEWMHSMRHYTHMKSWWEES